MSSRTRPPGEQATAFAKRVLVVDPDQKAWELGARLLIAQGCLVHRISHIEEAPARWPRHLYDLVVIAAQDPLSPELLGFCRMLAQAHPPVNVALLAGGNPDPSSLPLISRDQPPTAIAEAIVRLLR
jgi:CheY-like chemotaxis protein